MVLFYLYVDAGAQRKKRAAEETTVDAMDLERV